MVNGVVRGKDRDSEENEALFFLFFFFARAREEKEHSFLEESSSFVADRPRRV